MSMLSLKELEQRYATAGARLSSRTLRRLRADPRAGAQKLYKRLKKKAKLRRRERVRLDRMFRFEKRLWGTGLRRIAGVDEVGIGPMAGPVVAAAVVFPPGKRIEGIDDSKRLTPILRESLEGEIRKAASGVGIGVVESEEVDRINVYHAGLQAMHLAVRSLPEPPQHVLVDGRTIPQFDTPQDNLVGGDGISFSIACASIVAKVFRDRLMVDLAERFPGYGFANHKGYCTRAHQEAVERLGPCPIHRRSFDFIRELRREYGEGFYTLKEEIQSVATLDELERWNHHFERLRAALSPAENRKLLLLARRRRNRLQPS